MNIRRLTIGLWLVMLSFILILVLIPQENIYGSRGIANWVRANGDWAAWLVRLGLTRFASTWLFKLGAGLFALVGAYSLYQQFVLAWRQWQQGGLGGSWQSIELEQEPASSWWQKTGLKRTDQTWLRNPISLFAIPLFHLALLLVIFGGSITYLYRYQATVYLTEGQALTNQQQLEEVKAGPWAGFDQPEEYLGLDKFIPGQQPQAYLVHLTKQGEVLAREIVAVNENLDWHGYTLYLARSGFAPGMEAKANGQVLIAGYIAIRDEAGIGQVRLPDGTSLTLAYDQDQQRLLVNGLELSQGEQVEIRPGLQITFLDLRYWASFLLVRDPGLPWIIAGSSIGVAALFFWLFLPPLEVRLAQEKGRWLLQGRRRQWQSSAIDELRQIGTKGEIIVE